jgi:hypothetical protein
MKDMTVDPRSISDPVEARGETISGKWKLEILWLLNQRIHRFGETSSAKSDGRFGKQDFVYLPEEDAYRCPAGERLPYHYTNEEAGKTLRRYWTNVCKNCSLKSECTPGSERRITRWEHEHLLDAVQQRLDANPLAMRQRRETVEHPFGTMKARMGATHFLTKTLPKVATEMALSVLAYNLTRVMNIVGIKPLIAAIAA